MNYKKIYDNLIKYRQQNILSDGYIERHHIVPRSLGGSDEETNIVALTGREHYVAHLLLARYNKCSQTIYALCMMQIKNITNEGRPLIKSGRMYEWARKEFAKYVAKNNMITSKGEQNSQFGTRWICNITLKENRKISKDSLIPDGWIAGRNKWKHKYLTRTAKGSKEHRNRVRDARIGKKLSIETKEKISKANKKSRLGNESLTGRIWINNGTINKAILKNESIPEGFIKGKLSRHKCYGSTLDFHSEGVSSTLT
jgi:hypothetical protein